MAAEVFTFPDDNIDPREKGYTWILQYCKAAWSVGSNTSFYAFYNNAMRYREIRDYALGKQSVTKYKLQNASDRINDNTSLNRDASITPLIPRFRTKSLSKLLERNFEINAFAVDANAQVEQDKTLNDIRVRIAMNNALKSVQSPLQAHSDVQLKQNEPQDEEQLNMMLQFGWKINICMDAEMIVDWALNYNNYDRERKATVEDLYDFGAGGYKVYMDEMGKPRFRSVNLDNLVVSYCEKSDFSDATFIGEEVYVNVSDLVPYFSMGQIEQICNSARGRYNNPPEVNINLNRYYDRFKVQVLDLEFLSYNTNVYETGIDKYGNERFTKTQFDKINKKSAGAEYINSTKKVLYQAKWIVGTELMYDYGLAKNQVRKPSSWWDTQFNYVIESWNFDKMRFAGVTEGLISLADDYYETQQKLQNIKRKLVPYIIKLDLDALENVDYGAGGKKFSVPEIVDLMLKSNILVYRSRDMNTGNNQNSQAATVEATGMVNELVMLRQEMQAIKEEMMEQSGYNAATVGNPNPKMLNAGYETANAATNDSLWLVSDVDKRLTLRLADLIIQKAQIAVKMGEIKGYARGLGSSVVKVFSLNPDISLHEFAIFLEDSASPVERQQLIMDMNTFNQQGLLEPQDRIMIEYCRNLKYAQMLLSYLVGKRKLEQQQIAQQQIMQNAQVQQQSLQQKAMLDDAADQKKHERKMEEINAEGYWSLQTAGLKNEGTQTVAQISGTAKVTAQQIIENNKGVQDSADRAAEMAMHKEKIAAMEKSPEKETKK